jgi:glycogen phosphorylase
MHRQWPLERKETATSTKRKVPSPASLGASGMATLLRQYVCGSVEFMGTDNALYERHIFFDNIVKLTAAGPRERFEAFARSVQDILSQCWVLAEQTYERENPKRISYLPMEFLIGLSLANNVMNLLLDPIAH